MPTFPLLVCISVLVLSAHGFNVNDMLKDGHNVKIFVPEKALSKEQMIRWWKNPQYPGKKLKGDVSLCFGLDLKIIISRTSVTGTLLATAEV